MYSNAYIWTLEKRYQRIYLQDSKGETDIENRLMDTGGGEEGEGMEKVTAIYNTIYKTESQWEFAV